MTTWLSGIARQSWGTDGGSYTGGPSKGVLHTTETNVFPGYEGGQTCPHLTVRADASSQKLEVRQHVPLDRAARALRNAAGGVQTNRDSAVQIELVGTCNPAWAERSGYVFWPKAPGWALDELRALMRRLEDACGIRPVTVSPWLAYPSSYGTKSGQRLSLSQWDNYSGWVGHQHVPENDHGDPGNLDMARLLTVVPVASVKPVKVAPVTAAAAPRFPLPTGHVFGPRSGPASQHSGYYGANDRNALRVWQAQMRKRGWSIDVDGLYGNQTKAIAAAFQSQKKLVVDGLIGPATWSAAWIAK